MRQIKTAHIDLDGVMADFDLQYQNLFGVHPKTHDNKTLWGNIKAYEAKGGRWFYDLPLMPDARDLWEEMNSKGVKIRILTATGWNYDHVTKQKVAWCEKHFGIPRDVITTVRKSEDKAGFATPNCVLIDDSERSVLPWIKAGGHGILHVNAETSLAHFDGIAETHGLFDN